MIVTSTYYDYEPRYIYGGTNFFSPFINLGKSLLGKLFSSGTKQLAKSAASKIIQDVGKSALEQGGKKISEKVKSQIGKMLSGSKKTLPVAATLSVDVPNDYAKYPALSSGFGLKVV